MNERMIQNALYQFRSDHIVVVPNIHMLWGESDILSITRAGLLVDHEIKISRRDFKADFAGTDNKWIKHYNFTHQHVERLPNYFLYVVPVDLLTVHDVPAYAGLAYWHPSTSRHYPFGTISMIKPAPRVHTGKATGDVYKKCARSLMFKHWAQRDKTDPRCPGVSI